MYVLWWVAIGAALVGLLGLIVLIMSMRKSKWCMSFLDYMLCIITGLGLSVAMICSVLAATLPLIAKCEHQEFIEIKSIIKQVYESGEPYDNIGISQIIIEKNEWIVQVKLSKKCFGAFSMYYQIDDSELIPISLK